MGKAATPSPFSTPYIIDLAGLENDDQRRQQILQNIFSSCSEFGFFQIINHGVSHDLMDRLKEVGDQFFNLPYEDKMVYAGIGEVGTGYARCKVLEEKHPDYFRERLDLYTLPLSARKYDFWPQNVPEFVEIINNFSLEMEKLAKKLLVIMSENLGLGGAYLLDTLGEQFQSLLMHYYPAASTNTVGAATGCMSLLPHCDGGSISLLTQQDVAGLEMKLKDGTWYLVKPQHHAITVILGDLMEVMSNGRYYSPEHRVVADPSRGRRSTGAFHHPSDDRKIVPAPKLVEVDGRAYYPETSFAQQMKAYDMAEYYPGGREVLEGLRSKFCAV